ncbi:putative membrane protein, partial [mine drainage metagenome]
MIGEKVQQFQGKHTDLGQLQGQIETYLKSEGFTVQTSPGGTHGYVLQAKKGGFLAGLVDADRALT